MQGTIFSTNIKPNYKTLTCVKVVFVDITRKTPKISVLKNWGFLLSVRRATARVCSRGYLRGGQPQGFAPTWRER